MKFNKWFNYIWWGILILGCLFLLKERFKIIQSGTIGAFDTIVITILVILALIPFFSEMSFLGLTIKKDLSDFKKEVKEDIKELKIHFSNAVDVSNKLHASFNFSQPLAPPPDEQLYKLEERLKVIVEDAMAEKGIKPILKRINQSDIPEDNKLLFNARFLIEKELRRIWKNRFGSEDSRRIYSIYRITDELIKSEIIPGNFGGIIKEVYSICSPAIHGEAPSKDQVSFIEKVLPELVGSLQEIV